MYKLLIVDDEPLIRRGIKTLIDFESLNIGEIYEATTGEEALENFEKYKPDIILLDINIPKIDGLMVAEKIKSVSPKVKISIITGYNYFEYAQKAIKIGVEDYILKPISKKEVTEILVKLVRSLQNDKKEHEIEKILKGNNDGVVENQNRDYRDLIEKIIEEKYMDSGFTLTVLSDVLDLSSGYLSVLFKKIFGIPFQDYLLNKRMERARILLLTTDLKNYEIAEKIGFEDVNYFGLKFKKHFNLSPKQYRDKVINDEVK